MNPPRTLIIEGWRAIPHSYAIVNEFQLLEFLKQPNLSLRHADVPFTQTDWKKTTGIFPSQDEAALAKIPAPKDGEIPDAVYRIAFPYNLDRSSAKRTVVFGTAECLVVPSEFIAGGGSLFGACLSSDAIIVTPSNWAREGFINSGAPSARVIVVPHGFDPAIFHPLSPEDRNASRAKLGFDDFVFLSLGAMTVNKGIEPLLKAFAVVAQKHPSVRLAMKGLGALYNSREFLDQQSSRLTQAERALVEPRLKYSQDTLSFMDLAKLYQSADAYVSPYSAEGFNMPALEAIACGLPAICTAGGPTDDFCTDDFALRINSTRVPKKLTATVTGTILQIDFDHLVHQMLTAVESAEFRARARQAGPAFVGSRFTWQHVTRQLLGILFP